MCLCCSVWLDTERTPLVYIYMCLWDVFVLQCMHTEWTPLVYIYICVWELMCLCCSAWLVTEWTPLLYIYMSVSSCVCAAGRAGAGADLGAGPAEAAAGRRHETEGGWSQELSVHQPQPQQSAGRPHAAEALGEDPGHPGTAGTSFTSATESLSKLASYHIHTELFTATHQNKSLN